MRQPTAIPDSAFWTIDDVRKAFERRDYEAARQIATVVGMRDAERSCENEVRELLAAGWTPQFMNPGGDGFPYQWQWRRPPKRAGKPGRLFLSTTQAYNALKRAH